MNVWHRRNAAVLVLSLLLASCAGTKEVAVPSREGAARAGSFDWSRSDRIDIALTEFSYRPNRLSLREGQPYDLHFSNTGSVTHTFSAPEFFRSVVFREGSLPREQPDANGTIELASGTSLDIELAPLHSGTFPVECTKPLHALFGMSGAIDVR